MKIGSGRAQSRYVDEENPYWISFSDIMAGLLVIFVLASLALILELTQTKTDVTEELRKLVKAEQVRQDIVNEVQAELAKRNIQVKIRENQSVIEVPHKWLAFASDQHVIPNDELVRSNVLEIGRVLHFTIDKENRWKYLDTIFVEGHTDELPSKGEGGNWGLSARRANSVWQYWDNLLPDNAKLSLLKNHSNDLLFSVSGYGKTRPSQKDQSSRELRKQNRRIDIRITIKRPQRKDLERLIEQLGGKL